ncbi:hypothetical protein MOVI109754_03970 [Moritella viscosa]
MHTPMLETLISIHHTIWALLRLHELDIWIKG